ncbi:MAG TPA: CBS domain-containing protein [Actinomycetota bacterium]|jgi:CBS domain-containing protein|nr:CBS domain-containing protein [Actinomycetota bacterium]
MKARDLMVDVATVRPEDPAEILVELLRDPEARVVAVVKDGGEAVGILTEEDLLGALLPSYVLADKSLAGVLEEKAGETCRQRLHGRRISDVVDLRRRGRQTVEPDDTLIEVGAAMARSNEPGVLVVEGRQVLGAITVGRLLEALLRR